MKLSLKSVFLVFSVLTTQISASVDFDVYDADTQSINAGATNEVRRYGIVRITKTDTDYTLEVTGGVRGVEAEAVIVDNKLADILVTPKVVKKTHAAVKKAKKIEVDFILKGKPNPLAVGGYQIYLQVLDIQTSLLELSNRFLDFQTNAVTEDQSSLLFFNLNNGAKSIYSWYTVASATLLADTWDSDRLIRVEDSFGSTKKTKKTINVSVPFDALEDLVNGVYEFQMTMGMDVYAKPTLTEEINTYQTITDEQSSFFDSFLTDMDAVLNNNNELHSLSTAEETQLKVNRNTIKSAYKVFLKDARKQYKVFAADPDATAAQIIEIDAIIVIIDATILAINKLS